MNREYLAHFLDATPTETTPTYTILGEDLEEFNVDLNPQTETKKNILGNQKVTHSGYEPQSDVGTYYANPDDPFYPFISNIAENRLKGDACKTTAVEVYLNEDGTVDRAYKEDVMVVPQSYGGDTSGVQYPFQIIWLGNRIKGKFDLAKKTFTAGAASTQSSN